jgi:nitroreductase
MDAHAGSISRQEQMAMAKEDVIDQIRTVRQARQFYPEPVPEDVVDQLLEIARWSGSSRNSQPWHFVVVTDKATMKTLSEARAPINWVADAPLGIALVMNGDSTEMEGYDEGRVTERLLIAAKLLGYGGGTAWFLDDAEKKLAYDILGIPTDKSFRSLVAIGRPVTTKDHRPNANIPGRKPKSEIVSRERFGQS